MPRPVAQGKASSGSRRAGDESRRPLRAGGDSPLFAARPRRPADRLLAARAFPASGRWRSPRAASVPTTPTPGCSLLFAIGAIVMRAAGCTYNDIVDKDIDAQGRPHAQPSAAERRGQRESRHHFHAGAVPDRACGAALLQRRDHLARAWRRSARRALSSGQALQLLAASGAGARLQLGRAARLFRRARPPRIGRRSSSMPEPSPGPSATTPSTPIRTARTTSCSGSNRRRSNSGGRPRPGSQGSMRLLGSESP